MTKPRANNHQIERASRQAASDITDIETKTDNITVTGAVNLDSIKTSVAALPVGLNTFEGRITDLEENNGVITKTADYTATVNDGVILVDTNAAAVTITLPTAVGNTGKRFIIKVIDATNTTTIDGDGTETIDGATTKSLSTLWETIRIISDGANWLII